MFKPSILILSLLSLATATPTIEARETLPSSSYSWYIHDFNLTSNNVFDFIVEGQADQFAPAFKSYCTGSDISAACIFQSDVPPGGNFDVEVKIESDTAVSIEGTYQYEFFTGLRTKPSDVEQVGSGVILKEGEYWHDLSVYPEFK